MQNKKFIWDENKYRINKHKHNVTFEEAATVFDDNDALYDFDPDHSEHEDRFIILGYSKQQRLLLVCHCYRENEEVIRIFSARKATRKEHQRYGGAL